MFDYRREFVSNDTKIEHNGHLDHSFISNACKNNDLGTIKECLQSGQKINSFLQDGWTLLIHACMEASSDIVKYLIDSGADTNLDDDAFTPLMALCKARGAEIYEKRLKCLNYLIKANANVNATDKCRLTCLMYACNEFQDKDLDFVKEIIKWTENINAMDNENQTALHFAVKANNLELVELLIQNGADIALKTRRNDLPYDIAMCKGFNQLLPILDIQDKIEEIIEVIHYLSWVDMFNDKKIDSNSIDSDVDNILYGMSLEHYKKCFKGMQLKEFLLLNQDKVQQLGVDISVHRQKFCDNLWRIHSRRWNYQMMTIDPKKSYTAFNILLILGNIKKQLSIINSDVIYGEKYFNSEEFKGKFENKEQLISTFFEMKLKVQHIYRLTKQINSLENKKNAQLTNHPLYIGDNNYKSQKGKNYRWFFLLLPLVGSIYISNYIMKPNFFGIN
ncbi:hypothetical protein TKK_0013548 [Trichogramma kaykai]|uniref:SAM domain-containing protein n=1 Tax=Trichogramma kaykai TaxID=54128 RepID=A0ABD2WIJ2_9HYME